MARKKKPEEKANHERWLVSYADFITLLFAFFTTLYAISVVDNTKMGKLVYSMRSAFNVEMFKTPEEVSAYQGIQQAVIIEQGPPGIGSEGGLAKEETEEEEEGDTAMKKMAEDIQGIIESLKLGRHVSVRLEARGIVVSLAEAGFFASGSANVDPAGQELLDELAARLSGENHPLIVEGHTDNRPIRGVFRSNWELSTARATNVIAHLIEHDHFGADRLSAAGYGEHRPVADNTTEEGRAKNRRVDLVITFQESSGTAASQPAAATAAADAQAGTPATQPAPASQPASAPMQP